MRSIQLSAYHYAAQWPADNILTPAELTELGTEFVDLAEGADKEEKLLEVLRCFHGYLLKYMKMIVLGRLPMQKNGRSKEINKDTHLLLRCFIPREQAANRATLGSACRTLHLAFKGMNADEIYDQLMMCMVKSIRRYDPYYSNKVEATVGILEGALQGEKKFTAAEVSKFLGYDASTYLRLLVKRGYLVGGLASTGKEPRFARTENWPVPRSLFANGAVGLSYVASKWFRYYLVDFINNRMSELESKEGVIQLGMPDTRQQQQITGGVEPWMSADRGIPHVNGNLTNPRSGRSVAVDLSLTELPVDIGKMSLDWVNNPGDRLFSGLSKRQRHLLYCVFVREMDWESIAVSFSVSAREAKRLYNEILAELQRKVGVAEIVPVESAA